MSNRTLQGLLIATQSKLHVVAPVRGSSVTATSRTHLTKPPLLFAVLRKNVRKGMSHTHSSFSSYISTRELVTDFDKIYIYYTQYTHRFSCLR
jgi:hypothetical protein